MFLILLILSVSLFDWIAFTLLILVILGRLCCVGILVIVDCVCCVKELLAVVFFGGLWYFCFANLVLFCVGLDWLVCLCLWIRCMGLHCLLWLGVSLFVSFWFVWWFDLLIICLVCWLCLIRKLLLVGLLTFWFVGSLLILFNRVGCFYGLGLLICWLLIDVV